MAKKKTYRVVSKKLDMVLEVKGFPLAEEKRLYDVLREGVKNKEGPISIEEYKTDIVRSFLVDVDTFFDGISDDHYDMMEAVDAAYEEITILYPAYSLEYICTELNTETFMEGADKKLLESIKAQIKLPKTTTSVSLSSIEDINGVEEFFSDNIVGQTEAISSLVKSLKLMATGLAKQSSFLFVGPTGVGKTQVGKLLGEKFNGNFYKVNCAEYAAGHEYAKLIGSPPGYIGHSDKSLLAEKAEESNSWVFLFDEIEKAHHKLYDFLLSLLDDGTCTDNMGEVLDFSESIFIFTSNQGVGEINKDPVGFGDTNEVSEEVTGSILKNSVKKHFSPEFLNRLDNIILFKALTKKEVRLIAEMHLEDLPIKVTDALIEYVVKNGYSLEYGARNIARFIKNNISIKIADALLNKLVPKKGGDYYTPRIVKGEVKIVDTEKYSTSAV